MKLRQAPNGKLDMVVDYDPSFECADLWPNELQGMKESANYHLQSGSKIGQRLGVNLLKAVRWIEREVWAQQQGDEMNHRTGYVPNRCPAPRCSGDGEPAPRPIPGCMCGKPLMSGVREAAGRGTSEARIGGKMIDRVVCESCGGYGFLKVWSASQGQLRIDHCRVCRELHDDDEAVEYVFGLAKTVVDRVNQMERRA